VQKLTIFGATGGSGRELVLQALAAGHEVTALVRRPEALSLTHTRLDVRRGDVLNPADVAAAIAGSDVVHSALGVHGRGPTTLVSDAVTNIVRAMQTAGVRRLGVVSASGLGDQALQPWLVRVFTRYVLQRLLREPFADLLRMESIVAASELDWTIYRPPRLTLGPRTGRYRVTVDRPLPRGFSISRADLADCMLTHTDDRATYRTTVWVAY
jgi:putative NADH-flavin reductase